MLYLPSIRDLCLQEYRAKRGAHISSATATATTVGGGELVGDGLER